MVLFFVLELHICVYVVSTTILQTSRHRFGSHSFQELNHLPVRQRSPQQAHTHKKKAYKRDTGEIRRNIYCATLAALFDERDGASFASSRSSSLSLHLLSVFVFVKREYESAPHRAKVNEGKKGREESQHLKH